MYVSSAYSRCFISSLILISRYDHRESVISSHSFISTLVLSHSLSLPPSHTSRSSCVLRVNCVCCCVSHIIKCISLLFFFYIKYRISDNLTKLYPGINVLYAAREGDRSRRKSITYISCNEIVDRNLTIFAVGTFNYLLSLRDSPRDLFSY